MSAASFTQSNTDGFRHYLADVSIAARAFAAALFAARERQFVAQEVVVKSGLSDRQRLKSHRKLIDMANHFENMQPSLASELRNLAGRG